MFKYLSKYKKCNDILEKQILKKYILKILKIKKL